MRRAGLRPSVGLAGAALMAALTGLSAQLCVRIGPVPFTMQNLGIMLSGLLLGPRWGAVAQLVYLAMIGVGLPVAAGFRGGVEVLVGPTAGYLWAFPLAAAIAGRLGRGRLERGRRPEAWAACALAAMPIYALGVLWLLRWCGEPARALIYGALIFIPQDLLMDHVLAVIVADAVLRVLEGGHQ